MTLGKWLVSVVWFAAWCGAFWYAVVAIDNAWGMVILGGLAVSGFRLLVNTVDLLCGRWIRRGPAALPAVTSATPLMVRSILLEEMVIGDIDAREQALGGDQYRPV